VGLGQGGTGFCFFFFCFFDETGGGRVLNCWGGACRVGERKYRAGERWQARSSIWPKAANDLSGGEKGDLNLWPGKSGF